MGVISYSVLLTCLAAAETFSQFVSKGCRRKDNTEHNCIVTFYCRSYVDNIETGYDASCGDSVEETFRNEGRMPVHVILRDKYATDVPSTSGNEYLLLFIYSLDLSDNEYLFVPILQSMHFLTAVKFSRNLLNTARLSNANDLPSLTDLDYSYNTIDKMEVIPGEYQYRFLKKLNMSHNSLVNIPEAIFDSFDKLESLDLSYNDIYTLGVLTFEGIRRLLYLNLSYNRLIDLNSSLLRFSDLVTLELSHNNIKTLKVNDFNKLVNVKFLHLSYNNIKYAEKNVFAEMTSLTIVDLRDNGLESLEQGIFANASGLHTVYLSRNKLKSIPKYMFQGKNILQFAIEHNELEGSLEKGLFEGLSMVTKMDLSGQRLSSLENYAFAGLSHLKTLLLNNNNLRLLSNYSFKGLQNLNVLDLSHNNIPKLDIVTEDLISLQMLILHHNQIATISSDNFAALNSLQLLDMSHNNITHLKSKSFKSLNSLLNFKISRNPLSGALEGNTFEGLNLLPNLDISGSSITTINNASFIGMALLNELNISRSNITEIQFNSLSYLYSIQTVDLSYNQLSKFEVNTTDLINLRTIILSNNHLKTILETTFAGMNILSKIILSHNNISSVSKDAFNDFTDLRCLDLSYNKELQFNVQLIEKSQSLTKLLLSGIKADINYGMIIDTPVTVLEIAHSDIRNITRLNLQRLQRLVSLDLSNNVVEKLEVGALSNLTALNQLDLSYNNLYFIQPGAFKDTINLLLLNVSHNALKEISYGFFRGLVNLETIDFSYNIIQHLHKGRFYDAEHLETVIADSNRIDSISLEEFSGTRLSTLSIGDNPLPCEFLAKVKRDNYGDISITAQRKDETNQNIEGITCSRDNYSKNSPTVNVGEHDKLLLDIRDLLYNISRVQIVKAPVVTIEHESPLLANITEQQLQLNQNSLTTLKKLTSVSNLTSTLVSLNSNSNLLLGKILKVLTIRDTTVKPVTIGTGNATSENAISYINEVKQDLEETIAIEKQNMLELDKKIELLNSRIAFTVSSTKPPLQDKIVGIVGTDKASVFTEVCVGLILVILVGFMLFKLYKSKLYIPSSRSFNSTRHIADSMENSEV